MPVDTKSTHTHGGARPGSGRPPQNFTLRRGQKVAVWGRGCGGERATVDIEGKGRGASLVLIFEDETRLVIDR